MSVVKPAAGESGRLEEASAGAQKFPSTFYFANAMELFERLAHYGFYICLALYLRKVVGMNDIEVGATLGNFRATATFAPIACGSLADKIGFRRSLIIAFNGYAIAYATILFVPKKAYVVSALILAAFSGAFVKPVIMGTVVRTSPPGRQTDGFAVFYRMVNSGSVVGKSLAYGLRSLGAIRWVAGMSATASLVSLGIATFLYREPPAGEVGGGLDKTAGEKKEPAFVELLRGYWDALKNVRFVTFLLIFSGYYFMIEQFYMTFPQYVTRHIDEKAPLEIITLVNPAMIAIGQGVVTRTMKKYKPVTTMVLGVFIAAFSMLVMGAIPTIAGACLSGAIFAIAEMTFSPRFFDYIASFAPKGKAGMYMGLAFVPSALGAWIGGQVSGRMIARYLPEHGARNPLLVWGTYAGLGLVCALGMVAYAWMTSRSDRDGAPTAA